MKLEIGTEREIKKQSLDQWINYKTQGSIIRSRTRWHNEREKNTKFYFELEKRHFNSKTMGNLKIDDNNTLNADKKSLMKRNASIRHCIRQTIAFVKTFLVKTSYFNKGINDVKYIYVKYIYFFSKGINVQ